LSDKDGKTEKPSSKRLSDARKKGQIPKSQDLSSALSFAIFAFLLTVILTYTLEYSYVFFKNFLTIKIVNVGNIENNLNSIGMQAIVWFLILASPALIIAFVSGLLGNLVQVGFILVPDSLKPSFDKMNPVNNIKNIFGKQALFGLLKNILKMTVVLYIAYSSTKEILYSIISLSSVGTERLFYIVVELARSIGIKISLFLVIVGLADYVYQRYEHTNRLKMTKQEVKDEYKEMEGDPQVKAERKQRYQEMLSGNIQDVEEATVIITNPTHLAVAVRYNRGEEQDAVPIVLVKGADYMAKRIKERAKEAEVPIIENKPVARALYKAAEVGDPIPMDMYQAVAEILALIFQLEESKKYKI